MTSPSEWRRWQGARVCVRVEEWARGLLMPVMWVTISTPEAYSWLLDYPFFVAHTTNITNTTLKIIKYNRSASILLGDCVVVASYRTHILVSLLLHPNRPSQRCQCPRGRGPPPASTNPSIWWYRRSNFMVPPLLSLPWLSSHPLATAMITTSPPLLLLLLQLQPPLLSRHCHHIASPSDGIPSTDHLFVLTNTSNITHSFNFSLNSYHCLSFLCISDPSSVYDLVCKESVKLARISAIIQILSWVVEKHAKHSLFLRMLWCRRSHPHSSKTYRIPNMYTYWGGLCSEIVCRNQ